MSEKPRSTRRLSPSDWTAAALEALTHGGLEAVAIEPLAKRLGATKGSGYWHFRNREDLLRQTLQRWENDETAAVIAAAERSPDPADRLRAVFDAALGEDGAVDVVTVLLRHPDHPIVGPVLRLVTERRLDYLADLFAGLGLAPAAARNRALIAYANYLGVAELSRALPDLMPAAGRPARGFRSDLFDLLRPAGDDHPDRHR